MFFFAIEASAMVRQLECKPYKLKNQEFNAIAKLVKYPDPSLKNRTWKAWNCFDSSRNTTSIRATVESNYYEKTIHHVRYYEVSCSNYQKNWECSAPDDMFRFSKSKQPIFISTKLSTTEIFQLTYYINKLDLSVIKNHIIEYTNSANSLGLSSEKKLSPDMNIALVQLFKDGDIYHAGLSTKHICVWWVKIFQIEKNKFRSEKPEQICVG
jgi:hypothetical protein